ncbi:MAG: YdeI/OmpD-associated family protein [Leptolyngbyaceae bacterium]|nr:YdeI/OmpD-associated family protein [Leptolyngbyaceae bacterium]
MSEPEFQPDTLTEWRDWLEANHAQSSGIWLITFKKSSGKQQLTQEMAIEEALCFGWIDSKPGKVDVERTKLWLSPRKPRTGWSHLNKKRIATLLKEGRMKPSGLEKVEAAKRDGSWILLDEVEALVIPDDLAQAFDTYPGSRDYFDAFPKSAKRGILEWIVQAKRPETRQRRIEETARLAADNIRANQWSRKKP